jgi:hypothetical protein
MVGVVAGSAKGATLLKFMATPEGLAVFKGSGFGN